jgi:hypothetical protein
MRWTAHSAFVVIGSPSFSTPLRKHARFLACFLRGFPEAMRDSPEWLVLEPLHPPDHCSLGKSMLLQGVDRCLGTVSG